jgi:hypothetical protein
MFREASWVRVVIATPAQMDGLVGCFVPSTSAYVPTSANGATPLGFLSDLVAELIDDETGQQAVRRVQAS